MINVAFLLLVFFLMAAVIAPPDPLAVTPARAEAEQRPPAADTLIVASDGRTAIADLTGDAAIVAAAGVEDLALRADAGLNAGELAALLSRLRDLGAERVTLLVVPR